MNSETLRGTRAIASITLRICRHYSVSFSGWPPHQSAWGSARSIWAYPVIESAHVLGITIFMGLLLLWDCRLLGVTLRAHPGDAGVEATHSVDHGRRNHHGDQRRPALLVRSGALLRQRVFRVKVLGLLLAAGNAAVFHVGIERRIADWDRVAGHPVCGQGRRCRVHRALGTHHRLRPLRRVQLVQASCLGTNILAWWS